MAVDQEAQAGWSVTDCSLSPLALNLTLTSGQAFRWRQDSQGIWWGAIGETGLAIYQGTGGPSAPLVWQTFPVPNQRSVVEGYFRLDVPLDQLYSEWIGAEPGIEHAVRKVRGLRILRQPPIECFFAFQCATCNTVVKIERTIHRLAARYGHSIAARIGEAGPTDSPATGQIPSVAMPFSQAPPMYGFPMLASLACADEVALRADQWGYRAPRVIALARSLIECGPGWLEHLGSASYTVAKSALTDLYGIGEKVADCICLFCLDKDAAVPVDTHIRQIATELFLPELRGKSLTPRVYAAIAGAYRDRFGAYAGWAQQYLFVGAARRPGST